MVKNHYLSSLINIKHIFNLITTKTQNQGELHIVQTQFAQHGSYLACHGWALILTYLTRSQADKLLKIYSSLKQDQHHQKPTSSF